MSDAPPRPETELAGPSDATLAQAETEGEGRIGYGRFARFSPLGLALVMVLVLAAIGYWQFRPDSSSQFAAGAFAGTSVPDVTLTTFAGNTVRLQELEGSVVVVNFWAEWCAPCRNEMPVFQDVYEQTLVTGEPVVMIGVNLKSDREENALGLLDELGITYITGPDEGGEDPLHGPIQLAFGIPDSYPSTLFVRPDGTIASFRIGEMDESELRERIKHAAG